MTQRPAHVAKVLPRAARRARPGLALGVALGLALACAPPAPDPEPIGRLLYSLLAVGDTGALPVLPALRSGQRAGARGLASEDARAPVDALLLLGDNFYPVGLRRAELVFRIRQNLVLPYCRFVDLSAPRSAEVASACGLRRELRHPVPILAVLGNHDYKSPESPELQRHVVPEFIANWHVAEEPAEVRELGHGLSLILIDTPALKASGDPEPVRRAIRRAHGPWRILAAHNPVAKRGRDIERGQPSLAERIAVEGVPLHLHLSGHRHNLQVLTGVAPEPPLQVIAGGGSKGEPVDRDYAGRVFQLERTGFARIDLVERDGERLLVTSLFETPRYAFAFWRRPRFVGRWSVDRQGRVRRELPAPRERTPASQPKSRASASSR